MFCGRENVPGAERAERLYREYGRLMSLVEQSQSQTQDASNMSAAAAGDFR